MGGDAHAAHAHNGIIYKRLLESSDSEAEREGWCERRGQEEIGSWGSTGTGFPFGRMTVLVAQPPTVHGNVHFKIVQMVLFTLCVFDH